MAHAIETCASYRLISDSIHQVNHRRIKLKLKGLSLV